MESLPMRSSRFVDAAESARAQGAILGACIAGRDGAYLDGRCPGAARPELFAAMQATALAAAEQALGTLDGVACVVQQDAKGCFVVQGLDARRLVVVEVALGSDIGEVRRWIAHLRAECADT